MNQIMVYDKSTMDFAKNGRVLNDTLSCFITEELNGLYELELTYPLDARLKWQELQEGNIIKADGQLFRIYHKQKTEKGIKVNARHVFYDLRDNFLEDVRPENMSGISALQWILDRTQYPHSFSCTGDVGGNDTRYFIRKNGVEAIMGDEGIINTWGGEIERDNFIIRYKQARGLDRGVHVRYGKNIIGIEETINLDAVCTRMLPLGKDGLMLTEKYIDSQYINNYPNPKIRVYEFSDCETEDDLRAAAIAFRDNNNIDIPPVNYKIDFIELSKTEEYKNYAVLERVYMADTTTIKHSRLDIDLKAKVIKIKKNILTDRIEEVELGNFKNNLASAFSSISKGLNNLKNIQVQDKSALQQAIDNATSLLSGALGGYVVIRPKDNPSEILIMDTPDMMTAENVWRWNINGLGHSSTGVDGPYTTAITSDGAIVADFITTGSLNASIIKAGVLSSQDGTFTLNLGNGKIAIKNYLGKEVLYADDNGNIVNKGIFETGDTSKIRMENGKMTFINPGYSDFSINPWDYPTKMIADAVYNSAGTIETASDDWRRGERLYGKIYNQPISVYIPATAAGYVHAFTLSIGYYASVGINNILGMFANSLAAELDVQIVAPVFDVSGELTGYQLRVTNRVAIAAAFTAKIFTTIIGGR